MSSIFILCACNTPGDWDMKHPGITAIAHPLNPEVATRHGVFVFEDVNSIRKKYRESKQTLFL